MTPSKTKTADDIGTLITPLSPEKLELLDRVSVCSMVQRGQKIFYEGHQPWGIFILHSGRLVLSRERSGVVREKPLIVSEPCAIDIQSIILNRPHPVTAMVFSPSKLCIIPKSIVAELPFLRGSLRMRDGQAITPEEFLGKIFERLLEQGRTRA